MTAPREAASRRYRQAAPRRVAPGNVRRGPSGRRVTDGNSRQRLGVSVARRRSSVAARFAPSSRLLLGIIQGEPGRANARALPPPALAPTLCRPGQVSPSVIHTFWRSFLETAFRNRDSRVHPINAPSSAAGRRDQRLLLCDSLA